MQQHAVSVAHTSDLFGDQVAPPPRSPAERKAFLEGTFRNINAVLQRAEIREKLAATVPGAFAYVSGLDHGELLDRSKNVGREILATRVDCERPELSTVVLARAPDDECDEVVVSIIDVSLVTTAVDARQRFRHLVTAAGPCGSAPDPRQKP